MKEYKLSEVARDVLTKGADLEPFVKGMLCDRANYHFEEMNGGLDFDVYRNGVGVVGGGIFVGKSEVKIKKDFVVGGSYSYEEILSLGELTPEEEATVLAIDELDSLLQKDGHAGLLESFDPCVTGDRLDLLMKG